MPKIINNQLSIINCRGSVLLVVLFVIMAITILSLGFLTRSDAELACGQNMALRLQMDQLADSGLQHARGLILNPQDIGTEYWTGAQAQQLVTGSKDYYDVAVVRNESDTTDYCNYTIDCNAYRMSNGEEVGRSNLTAELRLDPSIALWVGTGTTLWSNVTINGDVYCNGSLTTQRKISGDVFASTLSPPDYKTGQLKTPAELTSLLQWPSVTVTDFTSRYIYGPLSGQTFGPYDPPRVCYSSGSLTLSGSTQISGMLLVEGNLTVRGANNVIIAGKNLPALYVTGDLVVEKGASLQITGLAVVGHDVRIGDNTTLSIFGGLFVSHGIIQVQTAVDGSGNDNTATLYNTPIWQPAGHIGGALQFDGTDDYAQTANSPTKLQLSGNYTISVWIKPNAAQNIWAGIVSKTDLTGMTNHWTLQFNSDSPKKLIIYHPDNLPDPKWWDTGIRLTEVAGAWCHIAVVRSTVSMSSYLNGVLRTSGKFVNNPGSGNGHLNIGADRTAFPSSSLHGYNGLIDDVRIYNRALNASEISSPPDDPNLIGHWRLDEKAPNVTITAEPAKTAIIVGSGSTRQYWSQAAGAFFRSIRRR